MVIGIDNMFDLGNLFFNELVGDVMLGILLGLFIVWFLSVAFKMPKEASLSLSILWILIVFIYTQLNILIVFVTLFVGVLFYYTLSKLINK